MKKDHSKIVFKVRTGLRGGDDASATTPAAPATTGAPETPGFSLTKWFTPVIVLIPK